MQAGGEEARPRRALDAHHGEHAQHDNPAEQDHRNRAGAPGGVPENGVGHEGRYEPEPPETATPELDEELTVPDDGWSELDEVLEEDEFEVVELEAVVAAVPDVEAAVPGMVSAPTVPKMPT